MKPVPLLCAAAIAGWLVHRRRSMGWGERVVLLLIAAGCVVYGVGLVHPPSAEKIIESVGKTLGSWTYLVVGLLAFLETGAGVGLIAPGEATILLGGFVAGQGKISLVALLAIVWTAAVAGDLTSYYLGRRLGRDFLVRHGPRIKITEPRLRRVEDFFVRWGGFAILLGRFVGLVRAIAPFLAGSSGMPMRRFVPYDVVGAGIWGCGLVLLGYVFWQSFDRLLSVAKQGALALGAVIVLGVAVVAAVRWLRDPDHRAQARAWLDRQAERPFLRSVVAVLRPPVRVLIRLVPGRFGFEVSAVLAVGLVGGFTFGALAHAVDGGQILDVDRRGAELADDMRFGALVDAAKVFSLLGTFPAIEILVLATGIVLVRRGRWAEAAALVAGSLLVFVGVHVGKAIVDRPRPPHPIVAAAGSSYPSGHAAYATAWVAAAIALARAGLVRLRSSIPLLAIALVIAAAIGLSRIMLRVHWWTDVLGGWGLGVACFSFCALLVVVISGVRQNAEAPA